MDVKVKLADQDKLNQLIEKNNKENKIRCTLTRAIGCFDPPIKVKDHHTLAITFDEDLDYDKELLKEKD